MTRKRSAVKKVGKDYLAAERRLMSTMRKSTRRQEDIDFCIKYLTEELLFFQELSESARRAIVAHAICEHIKPGNTVLRSDDSAVALYLVWSGSGTVYSGSLLAQGTSDSSHSRSGRTFGRNFFHCKKGDTFGSGGLIERIASHSGSLEDPEIPPGDYGINVNAHPVEGMVCFVVDFYLFLEQIYRYAGELCWAPSRCITVLEKKPDERTEDNVEMLRRFVSRVPFFEQLSVENQKALCKIMKQEQHDSNSNPLIFQQGWKGHSFYIIISGSVSVHQKLTDHAFALINEHENASLNEGIKASLDRSRLNMNVANRFSHFEEDFGPAVAELRHGDSFGEQALHLKGATRNATIIRQSEKLLLMVVDKENYNQILRPQNNNIIMNVAAAMHSIRKLPGERSEEDANALLPLVSKIAFFKQLPRKVILQLIQRIQLVQVPGQRVICEQGSDGDLMYIIISGSCAVFQSDDMAHLEQMRLNRTISGHAQRLRMNDSDWDYQKVTNNIQGTRRKSSVILGTPENNDETLATNLMDDVKYPPAETTPHWYGKCRANLLTGDSFGEKSIIHSAPRNATVITREHTRLITISKTDYDLIADLGNAISNPSKCIKSLCKSTMNRKKEDIDAIYGLFSQMTFFRQLPATTVHKLAQAAGYGKVEENTPIIVQGDVRCNGFYVVLSGSVSVHVHKKHKKIPKETLAEANIYLPLSEEDAHTDALRELTRDVRKHGEDLGDGTLDEDALYIRHEHRLHLPHGTISNKPNASGYIPAHHIDEMFGPCVACLGPSDTFGELSIHKESGHNEEDDNDEEVRETSAGKEVHHATTRAHASVQHVAHPPSTQKLGRRKSLLARRKLSTLDSRAGDYLEVPRRTASVITREPSEFLIIDNTTFDKLLKDARVNFEPELARRVLDKKSSERSKEDVRILKDLLNTIEFFKEMPSNILTKLCKCIQLHAFEKNDVIYRQGEPANCMYVMLSGKVSISKPQNETGSADNDNSDHVVLDETGHPSEHNRENKQWSLLHSSIANTSDLNSNAQHAGVAAKSVASRKRTKKILKSSRSMKLSNEELNIKGSPKKHEDDAELQDLISVGEIGDCLGEKSLMTVNHVRQVTVKAVSASELIQISRADFDNIIADHVDELDFHANLTYRAVHDACNRGKSVRGKTEIIRPLCNKIGLSETHRHLAFKGSANGNLKDLYRVLDAKYFSDKEFIYEAGTPAFTAYVVVQGTVELIVPDNNDNVGFKKSHPSEVVCKIEHGESFGASELLLKIPRQTRARACGNTVLLVIHKLAYQNHWKNVYDRGEFCVAEILESNAQLFNSLTPFQKSMIITTCVQQVHSRSSDIRMPTEKGFMLLASGECEVYYSKKDGIRNGLLDLQDNLGKHPQSHGDDQRRREYVRRYGMQPEDSKKHRYSANVQRKLCESPIKRRLNKSRRKVPPSKFQHTQQTSHQVELMSTTLKEEKRPSRELIGLVGPGFTLDSSGLPPGYSLKCKSTTQFMYLTFERYHAFMNYSTRVQLSTCRHELLQHLLSNHKSIGVRSETVFYGETPFLSGGGMTEDQIDKSPEKGNDFKISPALDESQSNFTKRGHLNQLHPDTQDGLASIRNSKHLINYDAVLLTKSRFNYSRAGIRSDWKFRAASAGKGSDQNREVDDSTGKGNLKKPLKTIPLMPMLARSSKSDEEKSSEARKPSATSALLKEEASLVRILSPRIEYSKILRLKRTKKRRRPLMGRARKDHLGRLFLSSQERFRPITRGASRVAVRSVPGLSSSIQGYASRVNIPKVGRIEVFDSRNYAGGSFAGSFW